MNRKIVRDHLTCSCTVAMTVKDSSDLFYCILEAQKCLSLRCMTLVEAIFLSSVLLTSDCLSCGFSKLTFISVSSHLFLFHWTLVSVFHPFTPALITYFSVDGDLGRLWLTLAQSPPPLCSLWWRGSLCCDTDPGSAERHRLTWIGKDRAARQTMTLFQDCLCFSVFVFFIVLNEIFYFWYNWLLLRWLNCSDIAVGKELKGDILSLGFLWLTPLTPSLCVSHEKIHSWTRYPPRESLACVEICHLATQNQQTVEQRWQTQFFFGFWGNPRHYLSSFRLPEEAIMSTTFMKIPSSWFSVAPQVSLFYCCPHLLMPPPRFYALSFCKSTQSCLLSQLSFAIPVRLRGF